MKKLIYLLLALVMVMAMTACGDENKKPYEEAVAAYNNGMYEEAAEKLAALATTRMPLNSFPSSPPRSPVFLWRLPMLTEKFPLMWSMSSRMSS